MKTEHIRNMSAIIIITLSLGFLFLEGCSQKVKKSEDIPTIEWWVESNPIRQEQLRLFNETEHTFKVKMQIITGTGLVGKVLTSIAGGSPPDVFFIMDHIISDFTSRKALESMDGFIKNDTGFNISDYPKILLKAYQFNGMQYALPGNFTPIVLYYNRDLFDKAGVKYPDSNWTWEDVLKASQRLTIGNLQGRSKQFGIIYDQSPYMFMMMWQNGGEFYNEDGTRCIVNSPENAEALTFLKELSYKYRVAPLPADFQSEIKEGFFESGLVSMMPSGRWKTIGLRKKKDIKFGLAPLFGQKTKATLLVSMGWAIPKGARHKKEAWELIKFLSGPTGQSIVMKSGDGVPVYLPLIKSDEFLKDTEYPDEDNSVYLESLEFARMHPVSPYITTSEMMNILAGEVEKFNLDMQSIEDALRNTEKRVNEIIKKNKELHTN